MVTDGLIMRDNRVVFTFELKNKGIVTVQQSLDGVEFVNTNVVLDSDAGKCGINFEGKKNLFIRLDSTVEINNLKILN